MVGAWDRECQADPLGLEIGHFCCFNQNSEKVFGGYGDTESPWEPEDQEGEWYLNQQNQSFPIMS